MRSPRSEEIVVQFAEQKEGQGFWGLRVVAPDGTSYEARACGCVLAISDRTGAPCTDGVDALVHAAGDEAALAAHLRALADDPELLARMRAASLQSARDLTWSDAGRVLAEAYAAALATRA